MAISSAHFDILVELHRRGELPQGGRILEIGEANFYGDFPAAKVFELAGEECDPQDIYRVARLIYEALFAPDEIKAIDAGGPTADRRDLNKPAPDYSGFDVVYNHGTAEHVFDIARVFRTIHDACKVGGLMLHECPFTGWLDHGFYCLQPTLFWDLSAANDYEIVFFGAEHLASRTWYEVEDRNQLLEAKRRDTLPDNLMLFVAMTKRSDKPFTVPMQGVYANTAGESALKAWRDLR